MLFLHSGLSCAISSVNHLMIEIVFEITLKTSMQPTWKLNMLCLFNCTWFFVMLLVLWLSWSLYHKSVCENMLPSFFSPNIHFPCAYMPSTCSWFTLLFFKTLQLVSVASNHQGCQSECEVFHSEYAWRRMVSSTFVVLRVSLSPRLNIRWRK